MPPPIPTNRQNTSKNTYTNADLRKKPFVLDGLYNAADQARLERETYSRLNAGGTVDPKDALLAEANRTLVDTQPTAARLAAPEADLAAAQEQYRMEGQSSPIAPVANAVQNVTGFTSMIPGPVGWGSEGAYALAGLAKAADPYSQAGGAERAGEAAFGALPLGFSGARALRGAPKAPMAPEGLPGRVSGGPRRSMGETAGSTFSDKQSGIPTVRHYWDALDLGLEPDKAAKTAAGRSKESLKALESLQGGGRASRAGMAPAASSVPTARTVPSMTVEAPYEGAGALINHPGAASYLEAEAAKNAPLVERLTSTWGARRTGRTAEELAATQQPLAWGSNMVDVAGSTMPAEEAFKRGVASTPRPNLGMDALRAAQADAAARYAKQTQGVVKGSAVPPIPSKAKEGLTSHLTGKPIQAGSQPANLLSDRTLPQLEQELAASTIPEERAFLERAIQQREKIQTYYSNKKIPGKGRK